MHNSFQYYVLRYGILLLLLPLFILQLSGNTKIDSLKSLLQNKPEPIVEIDVLNKLANHYSRSDLEQSFKYATTALNKSLKIGYKKGEYTAYITQSVKYLRAEDMETAISLNNKALSLAQKEADKHILPDIYNLLAVIYHRKSEKEKSLKYMQLALKAAEENEDLQMQAMLNSNIGFVHFQEKNYKTAEEYFKETERIGHLTKNNRVLAMAFQHSGMIHQHYEKYAAALEAYENCIKYTKATTDISLQAYIHVKIAEIQRKRTAFDLAEKELFTALKLFEQTNDVGNQKSVCAEIANLYNQQGLFEKGLVFGKKTLALSNSDAVLKFDVEVYKELAISSEGLGDYKTAHTYYKQFKILSDSVAVLAKSDKVLELESKYKNDLLKAQQAKNEITIRNRTQAIYGVSLLLFLSSALAYLIWTSYKRKQNYSLELEKEVEKRTLELKNTNEQLVTSTQELERFVYVASHDLKQPLVNIKAYGKLLKRKLPNSEDFTKLHQYADRINESTYRMSFMIEHLLEFSSFQSTQEIAFEEVNLKEVIEDIEGDFTKKMPHKQIQITSSNTSKIATNKGLIAIILKNIIENGVTYNRSEVATIEVSQEQEKDKHIIHIKDNGIGIATEYHQQIFDLFKRLHTSQEFEGYGVGLSVCKKIINNFGGTLTLNSELGSGSIFSISLPKKNI